MKESGPDPEGNPRLRLAIANAKGSSMPKDNIERAINKGKDKDSSNFAEYTFEGYLAHGIAVYVECTSDNQQRTVSNVRSIFNKFSGNLGTNGSLSFLFDRKGVFTIPLGDLDQDEFELEMIDAGAEDIEMEEGFITVTTAMEDFGSLMKKLDDLGIEPENAELRRIPKDTSTLSLEESKKVMKVIEAFEEDDDVQNVFHNMELTDELVESM